MKIKLPKITVSKDALKAIGAIGGFVTFLLCAGTLPPTDNIGITELDFEDCTDDATPWDPDKPSRAKVISAIMSSDMTDYYKNCAVQRVSKLGAVGVNPDIWRSIIEVVNGDVIDYYKLKAIESICRV